MTFIIRLRIEIISPNIPDTPFYINLVFAIYVKGKSAAACRYYGLFHPEAGTGIFYYRLVHIIIPLA